MYIYVYERIPGYCSRGYECIQVYLYTWEDTWILKCRVGVYPCIFMYMRGYLDIVVEGMSVSKYIYIHDRIPGYWSVGLECVIVYLINIIYVYVWIPGYCSVGLECIQVYLCTWRISGYYSVGYILVSLCMWVDI